MSTVMNLSYYIFREFAKDDLEFSDGKKISQMLQFVYEPYLTIMKFDVIGADLDTLPALTLRIQQLFSERFVQRLFLLHRIKIFYPTQDHLSKKLNISQYLENSAAFRNTGFIFAHPMGTSSHR